MYTIQSDTIKAQINPIGAELSSLQSKNTGTEYLWQGDPTWWEGRAPILFPIVCSLKGDTYTYNGNSYNMAIHGFASKSVFDVTYTSDSKIIFTLTDNEETRKQYPFTFLFEAIFEITGNKLSTTYRVKNTNDSIMYFSVGAHEAYRCPREDNEVFDDYYLEFAHDDTYISETARDGSLVDGEAYTVVDNGRVIPLNYKWFEKDTLIFVNVPCSKISLKTKKSNAVLEVDYEDAPHLGIWTKIGAPYVCIEPWYGLADYQNHDGNLKNKAGILTLEAGKEFSWTHSATITE
ncbi:MAG: aldose 1-epimerase family protein [Defluviitaleaceae bacterium]|nr:aldose 1-epimerase family protein [Defluviitaleaceae bacterium]